MTGLVPVVSGPEAYHRGDLCPKDAALACGRNTLLTLADTKPLYAGGRAAKADRLRQAKQEAEREVKTYKAQREEQYQKRIADVRLSIGPIAMAFVESAQFCANAGPKVSAYGYTLGD